MSGRIDVVDFVKGCAITTIVLMHLLEEYALPKPAALVVQFGGAGVHAFFLCSGFGLYLSHLKRPLGYGEFLLKRFKRVYWPYAIVISTIAAWNILVLGVSGGGILLELLSHLLLFKMFSASLDTSLCPSFWFISTIFQFYLCWPVIVRLYRMRHGVVLSVLVSLVWMTIINISGMDGNRVWSCFFLQYLWEFVLGMYIADQIANSNSTIAIPSWKTLAISIGIGLAGMAVLTLLVPLLKPYNDFFSMLGYVSVALAIYKIRCNQVKRLVDAVSKMAYEWYLVHYSIFLLLWATIGGKSAFQVEVTVLFVASAIVGKLYQVVVDRLIR